jgi:Ohr subfamily peroxiredoxin
VTKPLYTAEAYVTGGRENGHARTVDGRLDVDLRMPKELGGEGDGVNPEQLFAAGYAACFASVVTMLGGRRNVAVDGIAIESKAMLIQIANGAFELGVELNVSLPSVGDAEEAADLMRAAHQICPYSNATRGNIDVALVVNGTPL